jgi:DNA helicase-2/ATP-dependent DNA helicase PcrA
MSENERVWLRSLNDAQRAAVLHDAGPLAVLAGPGTGKTRVIVHRVARAIAPIDQGGLGADPESVLALAFTIKSADELRARLAAMVVQMGLSPGAAERIRASTVHSFGHKVVRRFADRLDLPSNLTLMDSAQQRRTLRDIVWSNDLFKHLAAQGRETALDGARNFIAACRNDGITPKRAAQWVERRRDLLAKGLDPEQLDERAEPTPIQDDTRDDALRAAQPTHEDHARLLAIYDERLIKEGAIAYDDLIALPSRLLREDADVAAILRDEHRHIVVDEFQDWNVAQIELLTLLAPPVGASGRPTDVCVVGDDDQSIYAFRGADDRAFERFAKHYPNHTPIALTKNYRSARVIVETANTIIEKANHRFQPDKTIEAGRPDDPAFASARIEGVTYAKGESDGAAIAAMILLDRAASESDARGPRAWSDYAIIARSHSHLDQIGAELELQGVPISVREGAGALDNEFVQDLRAWEEAIADPMCASGGSPRRILWRAPISMPIQDIQRYEREHAMVQREHEEPRPYLEWLIAAHASDPKVARFREVYDACRAAAMEHNADVALDVIAREAVLPAFDLLSAREKLRAGAWLVRYLAFVRDKQPNLPAPADLKAWRAYYADLSEKDQKNLARGGADRIDVDESGSDDEEGVQLLTAHSAKGLEFDTVFLPRVRPGRGSFPSSMGGDDDALPPDLASRSTLDASDEERRLFYVACTRAERRLVLLAEERKGGKTTSKHGDYFNDLTTGADPALRVPVSLASDWIARAGERLHAPSDAMDAGGATSLDRLLRQARDEASALLFAAESSTAKKDDLLKIEHDLAHIARRIAAIGRLRAGASRDAMDEFLVSAAERDERLRKFLDDASKGESRVSLCPMKAPLTLSYSALDDFERCSLCFYVKHVLGLDEPKTSELTVGGVTHVALEKFYKERRSAEADGRLPPGRSRLLELGSIEFERQSPRGDEKRKETREKTLAMLELAYDKLHSDADEVLETELNVRLRFRLPGEQDGAPAHAFIAKIDRVDRVASGLRVVDYKTGKATKTKLEIKKDDAQMSLYALALGAWLSAGSPEKGEMFDPVDLASIECPPGEAQYWVLSTGERGSIAFSELKLEKAVERIHAFARAMLDGKFEKGKQCKGLCAYIGG